MFIVKKILTPFLLPPGIFIILLIASGVWLLFKKRYWKIGALNCSIGIFIWALSISPVSDAMLRGLESQFKMPENPQGDVIILVGGGIYEGAPDLSGIGTPSEEMLGRTVTAIRLQRRLNIPIIVSGGAVFKGRKAEAPIVKRFLIDLGVPSNKIILEDKARDTFENAMYTKEICLKSGFKKPILLTSASHMSRSVLSFKKVGMDVIPFPTNFKTWENKKYAWDDYLPDPWELKNTYIAMHEYLGLLFYKLAY